jgi:Glyoxalase-like domain
MTIPDSRLDHLVVATPTLGVGSAWARSALGISPRPGGRHDRMGTHNLLLRLGPDSYLEVIAIDPAAPAPDRPRWFGLDHQPSDATPRVVAWVARTANLVDAATTSTEPLGPIESMSRGDLRWRLTVPIDGSMPIDGAGPLLIEWDANAHPAARLPDDGCELIELTVGHPDADRVRNLLAAINFTGPVRVFTDEAVKLSAEIQTPTGIRRL